MARKPRVDLSGTVYLVLTRSDRRQAIFRHAAASGSSSLWWTGWPKPRPRPAGRSTRSDRSPIASVGSSKPQSPTAWRHEVVFGHLHRAVQPAPQTRRTTVQRTLQVIPRGHGSGKGHLKMPAPAAGMLPGNRPVPRRVAGADAGTDGGRNTTGRNAGRRRWPGRRESWPKNWKRGAGGAGPGGTRERGHGQAGDCGKAEGGEHAI